MEQLKDITQAIGNTPLVKLGTLNQTGRDILVKFEAANPAASIKDRVARAIVEAAEASGELQDGGTLVEATSGNTGIGLAAVGAARGYQVILTMPSSMSQERIVLLRYLGARVILTNPQEGMVGAVAAAAEMVDTTPGAVLANQFSNPANWQAHYHHTGPEIWKATEGNIAAFITGVGTGGTITGVGRYLKERNPDIKIIAVEPAESPLLSQGQAGPHGIQGIGANFVPEILDRDILDDIVTISTAQALQTSRELARREGMMVGISSGAAVGATLEIAEAADSGSRDLPPGAIITVAPDTAERYLSTALFEDDN